MPYRSESRFCRVGSANMFSNVFSRVNAPETVKLRVSAGFEHILTTGIEGGIFEFIDGIAGFLSFPCILIRCESPNFHK